MNYYYGTLDILPFSSNYIRQSGGLKLIPNKLKKLWYKSQYNGAFKEFVRQYVQPLPIFELEKEDGGFMYSKRIHQNQEDISYLCLIKMDEGFPRFDSIRNNMMTYAYLLTSKRMKIFDKIPPSFFMIKKDGKSFRFQTNYMSSGCHGFFKTISDEEWNIKRKELLKDLRKYKAKLEELGMELDEGTDYEKLIDQKGDDIYGDIDDGNIYDGNIDDDNSADEADEIIEELTSN